VEVIVQEGLVHVDPRRVSDPRRLSARARPVRSAQAASVSAGQVRVDDRDPLEIKNSLAWTHGWLYLHGTLSQAVAQFNQYNQRKFVIVDQSIEKMNVTGIHDCHELDDFAESLRTRGVRYKLDSEHGSILLSANDNKPTHREP
jgi:transmembrane sensor